MVVRLPGPAIIFEHRSHFSRNKITLRGDVSTGTQSVLTSSRDFFYFIVGVEIVLKYIS